MLVYLKKGEQAEVPIHLNKDVVIVGKFEIKKMLKNGGDQ